MFEGEDPIGLDPTALETDLEDLIALLASGSADPAAIEPLLGEPLEGLTLADAAIWRQWAEDFRSRTAHRIGSRLRDLANHATSAGEATEAYAFLRLALRIQPERAESAVVESDTVLHLNGDGRYSDGLVTRDALDVSTGLTAEVEFRLPPSRTDRQRIDLCLNDADPSDEWVHLALQLRPDGYAALYLNRRHVGTSQLRIVDFNDRRWRRAAEGASVDTELLVRDLVVWPRAR